jgi:hypothetical protein
MAWEQTLAWTLMTIIGIWGAGTLLSFAVNRMQISLLPSRRMRWWSILPYRIIS